jgi:hypothetical protein
MRSLLQVATWPARSFRAPAPLLWPDRDQVLPRVAQHSLAQMSAALLPPDMTGPRVASAMRTLSRSIETERQNWLPYLQTLAISRYSALPLRIDRKRAHRGQLVVGITRALRTPCVSSGLGLAGSLFALTDWWQTWLWRTKLNLRATEFNPHGQPPFEAGP